VGVVCNDRPVVPADRSGNVLQKALQYGHLDETTGYLRILSFGGYSRSGDLKALEDALDSILSDPKLQALVIDMRLGFGGSDELGLAIANRLATAEYLAYTVQARSDPVDRDHWTPGDPIVIRPSSRPGFRGPVAVLTGPVTMSASETFIQALIGRPHVTRIGESTQGVFCDVLDRHLPNGWTFGLPNAVYRTQEGRAFDVTGIPPDVEVPVFVDIDVVARKDPSIETAKRLLH
jgi:C-terminal processing protease CtpA/Prc